MKISIAILAFTALSSAGLYGTGVIGNDAYDSMVEAELTGDIDAEVAYPLAMDDVFSKLVSIPVFEEIGRSPRKDIAPQIVISVKNNRQINWRMSVQNEHVADVIVNLVPVDAFTTQVNLVVNIADNSILTAADANSDSDVDKLEKLSRILFAIIIDQRLSGKQFDPNTIKSAYFADPNVTYLVTKLAAIDHV